MIEAMNGEGSVQSTITNPIRWTIADLVIFEGDRANRYDSVISVRVVGGSLLVNHRHRTI